MDSNYKQPIIFFSFYNINQIALGKHAHGNYCGPAPQPARLQRGQLMRTGAASSKNRVVFRRLLRFGSFPTCWRVETG